MNAYIDIGGSEVLTLKGALLVYWGRSRGFVSWHEVRQNATDGALFLGEAQEVTTDFVHQLAEASGLQFHPKFFRKTSWRARLK